MTTRPEPSSHPLLSSLGEFLRAGIRPPTPLAKAVVLVLVIKLAFLASLQVFQLSGQARPGVDAPTIRHVLGPVGH
jgi:hypothetical protein